MQHSLLWALPHSRCLSVSSSPSSPLPQPKLSGCKNDLSSFFSALSLNCVCLFDSHVLFSPSFFHTLTLHLTLFFSPSCLLPLCNGYMHSPLTSICSLSLFFTWMRLLSSFLSSLGCCFSFSLLLLSCLGCCSSFLFYLPVPGAMANHLITNALLRPHGTNNPYNTLLGDSAVYNNPAVGMYNTQGVPNVPILIIPLSLEVFFTMCFACCIFFRLCNSAFWWIAQWHACIPIE